MKALIATAAIALSCCNREQLATTAAVTDGQNIELSLVSKGWLYEDRTIQASSIDGTGFFPSHYFDEGMFGQQYFWIAGSSTKFELVPDPEFTHENNQILRISLIESSKVDLSAIFHHTLLDDFSSDKEINISFHPTFSAKTDSLVAQNVTFILTSRVVCFKLPQEIGHEYHQGNWAIISSNTKRKVFDVQGKALQERLRSSV